MSLNFELAKEHTSTRNKLKKEFLLATLSFIFALSSNLLLVQIANFPISWLNSLIFTLSLTLIFTLIFYNQRTILSFFAIIGIFSISLLIPNFRNFLIERLSSFEDIFNVSMRLLGNFSIEGLDFFNNSFTDTNALVYSLIGLFVLLINTLLSTLLIQKIPTHWYPWIYVMLILTLGIHLGIDNLFLYLIPLLIVSVVMTLMSSTYLQNIFQTNSSKSTHKHLGKAGIHLIFIVAISIVLATFFGQNIQYNRIYSPFWQGIVDDVMTLFPSSFQNELSVNSYSIGQDGFYPLTNRLGGAVELKNQKIADINGVTPQLLKVQSSDFYNGLAWFRTVNNPNYRYDSPFNRGSEIEVFNEPANQDFFNSLENISSNEVFKNYSYKLKPLRQGTQILFLSGTPTHLESSRDEALLFYFNQAATVYAKDTFNNEHFYTVSTYVIDANSLGFSSYEPNMSKLSALDSAANQFTAANKSLSNQANAYKNYLQLPDSALYQEGGSIYELAKSLASGSTGPYTTAQAILSYFVNNPDFSYSLDVETPPDNVDFLEYFFSTKVGYCTYYATAMTILARLNGIPARYVEGYTLRDINNTNNSTSSLYSKYAHAWTEVYLNGLGWVALDPTPGYGENSDQEIIESTPTPSPTPEPITEPRTEETSQVNNQSTTTSLSTKSSNSRETTIPDEHQDASQIDIRVLWYALFIIFAIGLLILLVYLYYKYRLKFINNIHNIDFLKSKFNNRKDHANYYWDELLNLHRILLHTLKLDTSMTELDLAKLLEKAESDYLSKNKDSSEINTLKSRINWQAVAQIIVENKYSRNGLSEDKLHILAKEFDILESLVQDELGTFNYIFKRILPPNQGKKINK